jgi:hypothetical protein
MDTISLFLVYDDNASRTGEFEEFVPNILAPAIDVSVAPQPEINHPPYCGA